MARLGTALLVLGLLVATLGALWQFGLLPGSRVSLPEPVALTHATPGVRAVAAPATAAPIATAVPTPASAPIATSAPIAAAVPTSVGAPIATSVPLATSAPVATAVPTPWAPAVLAPIVVADAADRVESARRRAAGYAVRLAIPAIKLDTVVEQGGVVLDASGESTWQTLPYVAVHYGDLTSLVGAPGNAVIAGHVVTLSEGNVFRLLYKLEIDDQVAVWDQRDREHDYHVVGVKLVPPSDTSVMDATPDETLTLITCGGTFDPVKRQFSDRLIVTAKPL
jgi:LPXTG-site transpeptidase (sortase) family protein